MAYIRKRKDSYEITVSLGRNKNGKQIRETTTFVPSSTAETKARKEAEAFAIEYENRIKNGNVIQGDKMTFVDLMQQWKQSREYKDLTERSKGEYEDNLNRRVVPEIGNTIITKITVAYLESIYNSMEDDGRSPATIRKLNTAVKSVMNYAFRVQLINSNPCDRVRLPKSKKSNEIRFLDLEQSKVFIDALSREYKVTHKEHTRVLKKTGEEYVVPEYTTLISIPYQFRVYYIIALNSGFRRGEMVALTWKDIDFENEEIDVNKAATRTKGKIIVKEPKTPTSVRKIVLPSECFDMLCELKRQQMELCDRVGSQWKGYRGKEFDKNNVFIQTDENIGMMMYLDTPTSKFADIINLYNNSVTDPKDKLPEIRLHDLRHTHATILLSRGVDIETVAKRLGHANASVTLDIYGHALKSSDNKASNALRDLFFA